jgi:hypothetical protein
MVNRYYRLRNSWRAEAWREAPFYLIHILKAAGSTIAAAAGLQDPGHVPLSQLPADLRRVLAIKPCLAVVRDPVSRIVSTFNYIQSARRDGKMHLVSCLETGPTIDDFVSRIFEQRNLIGHYFFRPASALIADAKAQGAKVRIISFRTLNLSVPNFLRDVGVAVDSLPREKVSAVRAATEADVSPSSNNLLRQLYRDDFALLENM